MRGWALVPEETVEVPVTHILKDHEQRATLSADSEETHDVLVLKHGEQLCLALKVLPGALRRLLQCLGGGVGSRLEGTPVPSQVLFHSNTPHPDMIVL